MLDWEQESGMLLASGDVRIIRVWDTQREIRLQVSMHYLLVLKVPMPTALLTVEGGG